ncbi:pfs domain protein [Ophiostoma piceae UAMH 11346]|uniref:Pfs domain protein n=1 Tax=Ophiostoma piceae (strain UAMH 11346) TaxID=1262450 RepID=S3BTJ7_OPHP1|nr:pfs domain protein [Ophiostoma piceae UAMH 11346]
MMFDFYKGADFCYVFLSDYPDTSESPKEFNSLPSERKQAALMSCKWFSRGWTLQELIAPNDLDFYSADGHYLGSKMSLKNVLSVVTKIPDSALRLNTDMATFSVKTRLGWLESRHVRREEDKAYCMLGIMGVRMETQYGEGSNAMTRLRRLPSAQSPIHKNIRYYNRESIHGHRERAPDITRVLEDTIVAAIEHTKSESLRVVIVIDAIDMMEDNGAQLKKFQNRTMRAGGVKWISTTSTIDLELHGGQYWKLSRRHRRPRKPDLRQWTIMAETDLAITPNSPGATASALSSGQHLPDSKRRDPIAIFATRLCDLLSPGLSIDHSEESNLMLEIALQMFLERLHEEDKSKEHTPICEEIRRHTSATITNICQIYAKDTVTIKQEHSAWGSKLGETTHTSRGGDSDGDADYFGRIGKTKSFQWLAWRINRYIKLDFRGVREYDNTGLRVARRLEVHRQHDSSNHYVRLDIYLEFDISDFHGKQGYECDIPEMLEKAVVLTGYGNCVQATTCRERESPTLLHRGFCWLGLFEHVVIAEGFPILLRETGLNGLELSMELMPALTGATYLVNFGNRTFIKGFSTMLAVTGITDSIVLWHFLHNDEHEYISYNDARLPDAKSTEAPLTLSLSLLKQRRHIVGWSHTAVSMAGNVNAEYKIRLSVPHNNDTIEGTTLCAGQRIYASGSIQLGHKDIGKPLQVPYSKLLREIAKMRFLFYDTKDERAWLVRGTSALLHLLRCHIKDIKGRDNALQFLPKQGDLAFGSPYCNTNKKDENDIPTDGQIAYSILYSCQQIQLEMGDPTQMLSSTVEDICDLILQIRDYFRISAEPGGITRSEEPSQMRGFDFGHLAAIQDLKSRRQHLAPASAGWHHLIRKLECIPLFGVGFGNLIEPIGSVCDKCMPAPHNTKGLLHALVCDIFDPMEPLTGENEYNWEAYKGILWEVDLHMAEGCSCGGHGRNQHRARAVLKEESKSLRGRSLSPLDKADSYPSAAFKKYLAEHEDGAIVFGLSDLQIRHREKAQAKAASATNPDGIPEPLLYEVEIQTLLMHIVRKAESSGLASEGSTSISATIQDEPGVDYYASPASPDRDAIGHMPPVSTYDDPDPGVKGKEKEKAL